MGDTFFYEILVPELDKFWTKIISLIDAKNKLLVFTNFTDVFLEVLRIEKVRDTGINDLQK